MTRFISLLAIVTAAFAGYHFYTKTGYSYFASKGKTISKGEEVDIQDYLPKSGRAVVEFTADW